MKTIENYQTQKAVNLAPSASKMEALERKLRDYELRYLELDGIIKEVEVRSKELNSF